MRRQVNDLQLQTQERINRFRQDASAELVRVRTELAMLDEQLVVRDDVLRRTTLLVAGARPGQDTSASTPLGGVVGAGAPVMEIVPLGDARAGGGRASSRPTSASCRWASR